MKILILDNYDSFTFNLYQLILEQGFQPKVFRNDKISLEEVSKYEKILLSPGPGLPQNAGIMPELIKKFAPTKSILGICLGHQAIGECFGGELENMSNVCHGLGLETFVTKSDEILFADTPKKFKSGRYHSWIVKDKNLPEDLEITAIDEEKRIMAMRHKNFDVKGIQFHPESILTPIGPKIINNWLKN